MSKPRKFRIVKDRYGYELQVKSRITYRQVSQARPGKFGINICDSIEDAKELAKLWVGKPKPDFKPIYFVEPSEVPE